MKFRSDFVTNSSSSSFICEVCGEVVAGWDMCLSDANMVECENGHTFCENEMLNADIDYAKKAEPLINQGSLFEWYGDTSMSKEEYLAHLKEDEDAAKDFVMECMDYQVPEECCPICTREHIRENDLLDFALKKLGIDKYELEKMTREYLLEMDKQKDK